MPAVRFFFDADIKGLGKLFVQVRSDATYPGDPGGKGIDGHLRAACPVSPGDKDPQWIPVVAALGWVVITRDRHLLSRPSERKAIVENGAKVIQLNPLDALNKWGQLEIVVSQWRRIELLADLPGPWLYVANRTGLRKIDLQ